MCYDVYKGGVIKMKYYTIHGMIEILGVTAQTLRNWDKAGKLKPPHTSPNKAKNGKGAY
jgi:predicted site-specific integrase-resolvase